VIFVLGSGVMIQPSTDLTGRTRLFASVEVFDHERERWSPWSTLASGTELDADGLLQAAIDGGYDDVRLVLHVTGSREELSG